MGNIGPIGICNQSFSSFLKKKYLVNSLVWLCQLLVMAEGIFGCGTQDQFPDQRSNPGPLHWELKVSHWTTRDVPRVTFKSVWKIYSIVICSKAHFHPTPHFTYMK